MRAGIVASSRAAAGGGSTFVGSDIGYASGGAPITLTLPTVATGDVAVVYAFTEHAFGAPTIAATGYTVRFNERSVSQTDRTHHLAWKALTAGETTVSCTNSGTRGWSASVHVFRGISNATPFDVTTTSTAFDNSIAIASPAITPTTANGVLLLYVGVGDGDITALNAPSTPSGLVLGERGIGASWIDGQQGCAYLLDYGAASTITPTDWAITANASTGESWAASVALRPA